MSRILLGVSGGIAAYKACELTRLLVKAGHDVVPLVTPGAERFVRAETFLALARRPPGEDLYAHLTRICSSSPRARRTRSRSSRRASPTTSRQRRPSRTAARSSSRRR
jgi:hypothetical protein